MRKKFTQLPSAYIHYSANSRTFFTWIPRASSVVSADSSGVLGAESLGEGVGEDYRLRRGGGFPRLSSHRSSSVISLMVPSSSPNAILTQSATISSVSQQVSLSSIMPLSSQFISSSSSIPRSSGEKTE